MKLVLKILLGLVFFFFLFQLSGPSAYLFHFKLNQAAITEEFCVNKEELVLECNGQCHLEKKLTQITAPIQSEQQEKGPSIQLNRELNLLCQETEPFTFVHLIENKSYNNVYSVSYNYLQLDEVFHPPEL